jgi:hypothetical protein
MKKRGYNFVANPLFLGLILVLLYLSALYAPDKSFTSEWIPILISFFDTSFYTREISIILSSLAIGFTAISLYFIGLNLLGTGKNKFILPLLFLIFVYMSPESIYFSGSSFAAPLFLWSIYFTIQSKKSDLNCFIAGFLISLSLLFDPHTAILIPLVLYYIFISRGFSLRNAVYIITSILIPFVFLFSLRYILFQDATLFAELLISELIKISTFEFTLESVSESTIIAAFTVILLSAAAHILSERGRYGIIKSIAYTRFIMLLFFCVLVLVLYPGAEGSLSTIIAVPASVVASEYLVNYEKSNKHHIQFLILIMLVIVNRIADFI